MKRRTLLKTLAAGGSILSPGTALIAARSDFTFVHCTDAHIKPELKAPEGAAHCFEQITKSKPDFAIAGGDQVSISDNESAQRCLDLYKLYFQVEKVLSCPVHRVIGNHDVVGFGNNSAIKTTDLIYGKRVYEDQMGKRYYSFDHKGWHFVVLDSIHILHDRSYSGLIDDEQLAWLQSDLGGIEASRPIVVVTHIPLATAWPCLRGFPPNSAPGLTNMPGQIVDNNLAVRKLFRNHNLKLVLQGHTHVWEVVKFLNVKYVTGGAVCGNWWQGVRSGTANGYAVCHVRGNDIEVSYQTFPWQAEQGLEPDERPQ